MALSQATQRIHLARWSFQSPSARGRTTIPNKFEVANFESSYHAILITSRKLRHYFNEYKITVITDFPLADILHNEDATGRISKWVVELGALSIDFKPRAAIKSQALVDFMAECREN
jgi:hypothetical protein